MQSPKCYYLIPLLLLLLNCQRKNETNMAIKKESVIDSILLNINKSKEKSRGVKQRKLIINNAYELSKKIENDTLILKVLTYKTFLHSSLKEYDSAISFSHKLKQLSKKLNDTNILGKSYYKLGLYYNKKEERDSAYYFYNLSKESYLKLMDSTEIGKQLISMAIIQSDVGDFLGSEESSFEALKYFISPKDNKFKASVFNNLAITARKQQNYLEAIKWYKEAIKTTNSKSYAIVYKNNIANAYRDLEEYDKSIYIFEELLKDSLLKKDLKTKARILDNLAFARWSQNDKLNLENDFLESLNIRKGENDLSGQIASNIHLANFFSSRDLKKAIRYAEEAYNISKKLGRTNGRMESLSLLINLKDNSREHFREYERLKDSNDLVIRKARNKFSKVLFEWQQQEKIIAQLNLENVEKNLKVEKQKRLKNVLAALAIILIIVSLFLYFILKARHKKEKLEQVLNTESKISKRVHDEVANDVYLTMNKIQNKGNENEVLDDLEDIYLKARDISNELSAVNTEGDFSSTINDLLLPFSSNEVRVVTQGISKVNWNSISFITKNVIYRTLQELMTNMKKHSQATAVIISFSQNAKRITINYKDNGIGTLLKKKNGLTNVENRIASIDGTITFVTRDKKGLNVKIMV